MKIRNFGKDNSLGDCLKNVRQESGLNIFDFENKLVDAGLSASKAAKWNDYELGNTTPSIDTFYSCLNAAGFRIQVVKND